MLTTGAELCSERSKPTILEELGTVFLEGVPGSGVCQVLRRPTVGAVEGLLGFLINATLIIPDTVIVCTNDLGKRILAILTVLLFVLDPYRQLDN